MKFLVLIPALTSAQFFNAEKFNFRYARQVEGSGPVEPEIPVFAQEVRVRLSGYSCDLVGGVREPPLTPSQAQVRVKSWYDSQFPGNNAVISVKPNGVRCGSLAIDFTAEQEVVEGTEPVDAIRALAEEADKIQSFVEDALDSTFNSDLGTIEVNNENDSDEELVATWTLPEGGDPTTDFNAAVYEDPVQEFKDNLDQVPMPVIPVCQRHEVFEETTKSLTMKAIKDLATLFYDDINAEGKCFDLIEKRIFGSLQLSRDLMENGRTFLDGFQNMHQDAAARNNWALQLKEWFRDSFDDCDNSSCVAKGFCENIMMNSFTLKAATTEGFKNEMRNACENDAWRFQEMINREDVSACNFDLVPMHHAATQCEAGEGSGQDRKKRSTDGSLFDFDM